jgi:hypothetical protein
MSSEEALAAEVVGVVVVFVTDSEDEEPTLYALQVLS